IGASHGKPRGHALPVSPVDLPRTGDPDEIPAWRLARRWTIDDGPVRAVAACTRLGGYALGRRRERLHHEAAPAHPGASVQRPHLYLAREPVRHLRGALHVSA